MGLLIVVLLVAFTVTVGFRRRNAELADAAHELRTLDLLLAEETGRSLQSVDLVLRSVIDQIATDDIRSAPDFATREGTHGLHSVLRARVAGVPQLDAISLVGADGTLVNFSRFWPIPDIHLADRSYFSYLRDHPTNETFLSEPVLNRGTGTPTVYLARRITAPDGTFLGLAMGAIELAYFERFYGSLNLEVGNFITLWRRDGTLLARFPPVEAGRRAKPEAIVAPAEPWHGVPGVYEKDWTIGDDRPEPRVVASRAVSGFPLVINVGRNVSLVLADWRRDVALIGGAATLAAACVLGMTWALVRRLQAYDAVTAALRGRERAIVARQQAEDALRQAQKMEAVGQLTGGVAHDFNNLLTVVRSSVDLLRRDNLPDERRRRYVDAIADATDRGAKLTGQLLAFARRQELKPEVFDAVANVAAVGELVARLAGSRHDVETRLPPVPCYVEADPNQFDTAIVNMAVNGRDAMKDGGRLTITVAAVERLPSIRSQPSLPGAFLAVSVADTGTGIAPDLVERVFEPFFTTKQPGEGTGLGLSQVFGFAKQSGGDVAVVSTPGAGTVFTLYLPRAAADRVTAPSATPAPVVEAAGEGARVLVVEDSEIVGRATVRTLVELGYAPVWRPSAERALAELEENRQDFDLVFSDIVMPGMNGLELGRTIRARHAGLPVVLTSGYSQVVAEQGAQGFVVLRKPYSLEDLGRALREAAAAPADADRRSA